MEKPDLDGFDSLWYLANYKPKKVLSAPIISEIITEKWQGHSGLGSLLEYSAFYRLVEDRDNEFTKALTFDKPDHIAKYHVWKKSLKFKYFIEGVLVLAACAFLQIWVNKFN